MKFGSPGERLGSPLSRLKRRYDVCVVGSGYGGAIAAAYLARAERDGQKLEVCVLERGREYLSGEFPRDEVQLAGALLRIQAVPGGTLGFRPAVAPGRGRRLFDLHRGAVDVLVGSGVGGTSLINAGVASWPDPEIFAQGWPKSLSLESLAEGKARAEAILGAKTYPEARWGQLPKQRRHRAHPGAAPVSLTIQFEEGPNAVGVLQQACVQCGDCITGCNYGAKNSTAMNYLPWAVSHGAEIYPEIEVLAVSGEDHHWRVEFRPVDFGEQPLTDFLEAQVVVLAAGTMGTPKILHQARRRGLKISEQLGKKVSANGDYLALLYNGDKRAHAVGHGASPSHAVGPVGPTISQEWRLGQGRVQEGTIPGALAQFAPILLRQAAGTPRAGGPSLLRELESTLLGARRGAADHTRVTLAMGPDEASLTLELPDDPLTPASVSVAPSPGGLAWYDAVEAALAEEAAREGAQVLGAERALSGQVNKLLSVHPLGGCVMADSPEEGVVNDLGQVFGPDGVYSTLVVMDGSMVPTALGANPFLTISALAERALPRLIEAWGWHLSPPQKVDYRAVPLPGPPSFSMTERLSGPLKSATRQVEAALYVRISADSLEQLLVAGTEASLEGVLAMGAESWRLRSGRVLLFEPTYAQSAAELGTLGRFVMRYAAEIEALDGQLWRFEGTKRIGVQDGEARVLASVMASMALIVRLQSGEECFTGSLELDPVDLVEQADSVRIRRLSDAGLPERVRFFQTFLERLVPASDNVAAQAAHARLVEDPVPPMVPLLVQPATLSAPQVFVPQGASEIEAIGGKYRLTRFRPQVVERGSILLAPGFGVSTRSFLPQRFESLVHHLVGAGYDVWLFDYRASPAMPTAGDPFRLVDIAREDWPAAVSQVYAEAAREGLVAPESGRGLKVLAHCVGALSFLWAKSSFEPMAMDKVSSALCSQLGLYTPSDASNQLKARLGLSTLLSQLFSLAQGPSRDRLLSRVEELLPLPPSLDRLFRERPDLLDITRLAQTLRAPRRVKVPAPSGYEPLADRWRLDLVALIQEAARSLDLTVEDTQVEGVLQAVSQTLDGVGRPPRWRALLPSMMPGEPEAAQMSRLLPEPWLEVQPSDQPFDRLLDGILELVPVVNGERSQNARLRRIFAIFGQVVLMSNLSRDMRGQLPKMFGKINIHGLDDISRMMHAGGLSLPRPVAGDLGTSPLRRLAMPISFLQGALNQQFDPAGTEDTLNLLSEVNGRAFYHRELLPGYAHMDCFVGKNAPREVFPVILGLLEDLGHKEKRLARS